MKTLFSSITHKILLRVKINIINIQNLHLKIKNCLDYFKINCFTKL